MMSDVRYPFASSTRLTAIRISLLSRRSGQDFLSERPPSSRVVFAAGDVPHYTLRLPNLDLNAESRGQFLDGRGFLLAHLRAAEAKEASFFGGLGDLLRHSDQPLLESLGLIGFGFFVDKR